jgi:hypothetical protein
MTNVQVSAEDGSLQVIALDGSPCLSDCRELFSVSCLPLRKESTYHPVMVRDAVNLIL